MAISRKVQILCLSLVLHVLAYTTSAHAQKPAFALVDGKVVSCSEAVKFRDGRLAQEMTIFCKRITEIKRRARNWFGTGFRTV